MLGLPKANSRTRKIPEAKKLAQSQAAKASQLDEEQSRAACKACQTTRTQTQQQQQQNMGAEASAEAGAEVFAEAIGDMCLGLPPGAGMLLRAPIHIAKAAATPKPPIHLHIGGAAVTAAAAAGAALHYGIVLCGIQFRAPNAIDAMLSL